MEGDGSCHVLSCRLVRNAKRWWDVDEDNVFRTKGCVAKRAFGAEPVGASKVLCCVCPQSVGNTVAAAWIYPNRNCSLRDPNKNACIVTDEGVVWLHHAAVVRKYEDKHADVTFLSEHAHMCPSHGYGEHKQLRARCKTSSFLPLAHTGHSGSLSHAGAVSHRS